MGDISSKGQNINNEGAAAEIQNNIQGSSNTVNIHYPTTTEPELEDFNFPKPIDSFKGREKEFKQLDDYLFLDDKKKVVIWGLPGFGKSEMVKQFAQKCKDNNKIKHICWIQADNKHALKNSLKDLVKILKLPEVDDLRVLLQIVSKRYENSGTLFVFDDVDSPRSLLDWETPSGCWTLFTSHFGEWSDSMPNIELGPLDHEAAIAVLQHQQDPIVIADPDLSALATLLDNVPLALQLAAAYIRQEKKLLPEKFTVSKYIQSLQKSLGKIVNEPVPLFLPYENCIQKAMNLSLEKIGNLNTFKSNLALDIINMISYLNQYHIREKTLLEFSLIQKKLEEKVDEDEECEPEAELQRALHVLESYSFVHLDNGFIRIHGLVQHSLMFNHNKPNDNMDSYYKSCLKYVLNNPSNWHTLSILKQADKKLEIFKKFYDEYESNILDKDYEANSTFMEKRTDILILQIPELDGNDNFINKIIVSTSFLGKLVLANAKKCLTFILDKLGSQAKEVIINHNLLIYVIETQEPNMLNLLQTYERDIIKKTLAGDWHILYSTTSSIDKLNFILEHSNINVNDRDFNGNTCIYHLVSQTLLSDLRLQLMDKTCEMMRVLVDHGATVYGVTNRGHSLLHVAVNFIKTTTNLYEVEFIVDVLQVDVNALDIFGQTALHYILDRRAAMEIDDELTSKVVKVLVRRGADVHMKNYKGISHLDIIENDKFHFLLPIISSGGTHDEN